MKKSNKPITGRQLIAQQRKVDRMYSEYYKQKYLMDNMIKNSGHLDGKLAKLGSKTYFIRVQSYSCRPSADFMEVK